MLIQWEQLGIVYITNTCSTQYFIQLVCIAILVSLHVPAGACILVASESPIHVSPVQRVLKHCGAHKCIILYKIYIIIQNTHDPQHNNLRTLQLVGFAC